MYPSASLEAAKKTWGVGQRNLGEHFRDETEEEEHLGRVGGRWGSEFELVRGTMRRCSEGAKAAWGADSSLGGLGDGEES